MKGALFLLLLPVLAQAAEHDHAAHTAPAAPEAVDHSAHAASAATEEVDHSAHAAAADAVDHSAHEQGAQPAISVVQQGAPDFGDAHEHLMAEHGASLNFLIIGERFEQSDDDSALWELQGWLGYDYDKVWLKTEGEYDTQAHATEHSEVQLLYSRAIAPYWDLQAGLRRDDAGSESRTHATLGLMGLAPYWFEVDTAAFISEAGDLSARLEAEYELRFTQKLLLQPRLELNYSFADDPEMLIGNGLSEASFGLRLRYEWRRELAPYVGIEWSRAYGDTANLLRAAGHERGDARVVAGLRFWY